LREDRMHPLWLALCSVCLASAAAVGPVNHDKDADEPALLRANARAEAAWARRLDQDLAAGPGGGRTSASLDGDHHLHLYKI
jgi:hypothetical protein